MRKWMPLVLVVAASTACEYSVHVAQGRPDTGRLDAGSLEATPVEGDHVELFATGRQVLGDFVLYADLDDDGLDDIVIADRGNSDAYGMPFRGGGVYIAYGRAGRIGPSFDLDAEAAHIVGPTHETGGVTPVHGDFDGDGHEDLAIAVAYGTLHVRYGDGSRLTGTHFVEEVTVTLTGGEQFGETLGSLGDLDGDGCDELAVGGTSVGVVVLRGSRARWVDGDVPRAATVFEGSVFAVAQSAGDLDADGALDVLVTHEDGTVGVFYGPIALEGTHTATSASATLALYGGYWPGTLTGIDVDQDGYADIAASDIDGVDPAVSIFLGGATRMVGTYVGTDAPLRLIGERSTGGAAVVAAGDANGDGRPDLLVGVPGTASGELGAGRAYRVLGPIVGGALAHAPVVWSGTTSSSIASGDFGDFLGYAVAQDGDFDGDGLADAVFSVPTSVIGFPGRHVVYLSYGRRD